MADMPRILHVVGARPNFMKVAPILREMEARGATRNVLLHSGQHYDPSMSDDFFRDLGIRAPDVHLGVGSSTHGRQTADILAGTEEVLLEGRWDMVVVMGDINSTVAAALAAAKLGIAVAHVEAGLRSGDRRMPEELNRILTDQLSDLCLTPSRDAEENLRAEGIGPGRIVFAGNVMIDTLLRTLQELTEEDHPIPALAGERYAVVTLHRPSNVDDRDQLSEIMSALKEIAERIPVVFPVHPRTAKMLTVHGVSTGEVRILEPLGYRRMLALQAGAGLVITDSGGLQEESTVLGVPCLTLRSTTERPVTIAEGTNRLVPIRSRDAIREAFEGAWGTERSGVRPEGWDGRASIRIADAIEKRLSAV